MYLLTYDINYYNCFDIIIIIISIAKYQVYIKMNGCIFCLCINIVHIDYYNCNKKSLKIDVKTLNKNIQKRIVPSFKIELLLECAKSFSLANRRNFM